MKKVLLPLLAVVSLGLGGCVVNVGGDETWSDAKSWQAVQEKNQRLISQLELGMSLAQVQERLGIADFSEGFNQDGTTVQVLFYRTQRMHGDGKTTKDECTPLIFRQQQLSGWGDRAYQQL